MDPLTSLSVAGAIVQFVDFGCRLLAEGRELYRSTTGVLTANEELELATTDLRALVNKLRHSFTGPSSEVSQCFTKEDQEHRRYFDTICDEAVKVAEELIRRLDKLKLRGSGSREWKSFRLLIKGAWSRNEVASLTRRLFRENLDAASIRLSARFDALDEQTQRIISTLLNNNTVLSQEITVTLSQIVNRLEAINEEQHRRARDVILERWQRRAEPGNIYDITASVELLSVSSEEEDKLRNAIQTAILESLKFPTMTNRYEDVVDAYPETFEWAFHDSNEDRYRKDFHELSEYQSPKGYRDLDEEDSSCNSHDSKWFPWSSLPNWLKKGKGVYWIHGKAGSGKSTLMKHIFDDQRTHKYLSFWARNAFPQEAPLCLATFFFWNSGTKEQKSQMGLLRALLFQVLEQYPDLIPVTFPAIWARRYSRAVKSIPSVSTESWSLRGLSAALKTLLQQTSLPLNICFLIDGLDEFGGDHEDIADLFKDAANSPCVKACLSSRPWVVFEDSFRDCPSMRLQDLTRRDIVHYVTDRFHRNSAFQRLEAKDPGPALALIHEIVGKADGVFLWVRIVVKSLLDGIRNLDAIPDLWMRLRLLPRELEPLYQHLLACIEPVYLLWASKAFQILRTSRELNTEPFGDPLPLDAGSALGVRPLSILALYLAMNPGIDVMNSPELATQVGINARCQETQIQLTARCAGLLEVPLLKGQKKIRQDSLVQYLHRTVRDFLETDAQWSDWLAHTATTDFDPCLSMMHSSIQHLRIVFREYSGKSHLGRDMRIINSLAADTMAYAFCADSRGTNHQAEFAMLDDLEELMTFYASPLHAGVIRHWSQRLIAVVESEQPQMEFLGLATIYCLAAYVEEKLKQRSSSEAKDAAIDLMHHLYSRPYKHMLTCSVPSQTAAIESLLSSICAEDLMEIEGKLESRMITYPIDVD
ncbi:hypothetical protein FGG08_004553 [Glutinoglossum americanum]|uniref:NACHT domain-containing protein n=1 Tax=Glutinoglossum americanum TaxID=1670608 RepID=A0A9P8I4W7_9PEZI|nr:hypothetical protein FGG08_004553 [Glutinoglossum americanum]